MNAFRSFVAVCLCAPMAVGLAQEPRRLVQPDSVSIELAAALASAGGIGGDPQILIGSLPGWLADHVQIPRGASIMGAALSGSTVVGIVTSGDAPETLIKDFSRELPKFGWGPPPAPRILGGGFRWASQMSQRAFGQQNFYCREQQLLTVSAVRRRITTIMTIRATSIGGTNVCNPPALPPGYTPPPYPTLINPEDATDGYRNGGSCMKAMSDEMGGGQGTSTMLNATTSSAVAIMEHYTKQLKDSGWGQPLATQGTITRIWVRPDSTGTPMTYQLSVTPLARDSTCYRVELNVRKPRKEP